MDPVNSELGLGKESGLQLQCASIQIACLIFNHQVPWGNEAASYHRRSFMLLHDGIAPADAVWTKTGEQAWRECPISVGKFIAPTVASIRIVHLVCVFVAEYWMAGHECVLFIVGRSLTAAPHYRQRCLEVCQDLEAFEPLSEIMLAR